MRIEPPRYNMDLQPIGTRKPRPPRIASEKADIEYLLGVLNELASLVTTDVLGMPGSGQARQYPMLRQAIWTARTAAYRVVKNRDEREARTKRKRARRAA